MIWGFGSRVQVAGDLSLRVEAIKLESCNQGSYSTNHPKPMFKLAGVRCSP